MVKTAADYGISFRYGATDRPYSPSHPHRGDDRACPMGTPVVCGGVNIGLVGMTGLATGPHVHIQEWQGSVSNTRKPQNSFKGGVVTAATSSSDFGNYVTVTLGGWNTTYAHLSKINVKVGQVLSGTTAGGKLMDTDAKVGAQYFTLRGNSGTAAERKAWIGKSYEEFNKVAKPEAANHAKAQTQIKALQAQVKAKDAEIAKLKANAGTGNPADVADASKWRQFINMLPFIKK